MRLWQARERLRLKQVHVAVQAGRELQARLGGTLPELAFCSEVPPLCKTCDERAAAATNPLQDRTIGPRHGARSAAGAASGMPRYNYMYAYAVGWWRRTPHTW